MSQRGMRMASLLAANLAGVAGLIQREHGMIEVLGSYVRRHC